MQTQTSKTIIYSWCTPLNDIDPSDDLAPIACQNQDIFAGSIDGPPPDPPTPDANCFVLSNGNYNNIDAVQISGKPVVQPTPQTGLIEMLSIEEIPEPSPYDTELNGVGLIYNDGATCASGGQASMQINMYCNPDLGWTEYQYSYLAHGSECNPQVDFVTRAGCPILDISELWTYLEQYSVYFGAVGIIVGFMLVLWGRKFIKPAIFIAGFLATLVLSMLIFYAVYYSKTSKVADFWWILGAGALAGILVGLLLSCFVKLGAALLAGWGGYCLGLIFYEAVLFRAGQEWLFWTSCIVCALVCAVLAFFLFDVMCILGTVALGAYCMVRGVAVYAGHYYNEAYMAQMLQDGLLADIDPWYWAYVAGFVLMFVGGFWYQYSVLK